jgi:hypothetical protein
VQVLVGPTTVFDEYFLGPGTAHAYALLPGCSGGAVEVPHVAGGVDGAAGEVERARVSTHLAVAHRRAATAGESESRMATQESEDVLTGVRTEAPDDVQFTRGTSAQMPVQLVTRAGLLPVSCQDHSRDFRHGE